MVVFSMVMLVINLSNPIVVQLWVIFMSDFGMIFNQYFLQRKRDTNGVGESDRWLGGKKNMLASP